MVSVVTSGQPPGPVVRASSDGGERETRVTPQVLDRGRGSLWRVERWISAESERSVVLTFKDKPGKLINPYQAHPLQSKLGK